LIAVKDSAKPPSDHVDPYHLGIRFVGFLTANLLLRFIYWFAEFSDQLGLFSSSVAEDRIAISNVSMLLVLAGVYISVCVARYPSLCVESRRYKISSG
jgi:hypothetical protein